MIRPRGVMVSGVVTALVLTWSVVVPAAAGAVEDPPAQVAPEVTEQLDSQGEASVLVEMSTESAHAADAHEVREELVGEGGEVLPTEQPLVAATVDRDKVEDLRSSRWVSRVLPNNAYRLEATPGLEMIQAPQAWGQADGSGQRIAVVDTGVDVFHPQLFGRVEAQACFSSTGISKASVHPLCPGGNARQATGFGSGMPCTVPGTGSCLHGTHVAGIAAATAPGASLLAVQVFSFVTDPITCDGVDRTPCLIAFDSDLIAALRWVSDQVADGPIAAVNLSVGGKTSPEACDDNALADPIKELHDLGVATVVASGNGGEPNQISWPACVTEAVAVGSVDSDFRVSSFSNSSPLLDFLAPGRSITSAIPGGGMATLSGTSMATPHVSGAMAVLRQAKDVGSVEHLSTILRETGLRLFDFRNGRLTPLPRLGSAVADIAPMGHLDDVAVSGQGSAIVTGWAIDLDTEAPVEARVLVNGEVAWSGTAGFGRPEVATSYPGLGPSHGVLAPVELPKGLSEVCLAAQDASWPDRPPVEVGCDLVVVDDDVMVLPPAVFGDVSMGHPFYAEIAWMSNTGISEGFPSGAFRPSSTLSRQAMAAFLYRQAGSPEGLDPECSAPPFADVTMDNTFCGEIAWLKAHGITTGFADGTFRPDSGLTRQAMAAFLYRQAGAPDGLDPECSAPPFADVTIDNTFCGEIAWLSVRGISEGFDDYFFQPTALITRQAIAAFLYRYQRLDLPGT